MAKEKNLIELVKGGMPRDLLEHLIQYSFLKLEHPVDTIRYQAKEMLSNILCSGKQLCELLITVAVVIMMNPIKLDIRLPGILWNVPILLTAIA